MTLNNLTDEELTALAKNKEAGAEEELIKRYKPLVKGLCRSYYLIGGDSEDLIQEGMIGLFNAVKGYQDGHGTGFKAFCKLCVTRRILSAVKLSQRDKHRPLNNYYSLNQPLKNDVEPEENEAVTLLDVLSGGQNSPENALIEAQEIKSLKLYIDKNLSALEKKILNLYLDGKTYSEISKQVDKPSKSIDNALRRIKNKLKETR
jgi:RNA polymerase sporulation-specific sigma factor